MKRPASLLLGLACITLAASLGAAPGQSASAADDFKTQKERYERWQERPSLYLRHKGRVEFAKTRDVRALAILAKSYAKPEAPKDQVQYLLASLCADQFRAPPHLEPLRAWRAKHKKPRDAWLWFRTLQADIKIDGTPETVRIAREATPVLQRVSALEALIDSKDEAALTLAAEALADLPSKPFDRMILMESAAEALYVLRAMKLTETWKKTAALLHAQLEQKSTLDRTRRVVEQRAPPPRPQAREPGEGSRYAPPPKPTFLGIEAGGVRIAYVIDMSDSMLTPLTGKEIEDLKRPPNGPRPPAAKKKVVTGGKSEAPAAERPPAATPAEKKAAAELAALPWSRIRNRFDAAREFLRLSLKGLTPQQSFCVIGFGSEAKLLASTPGLRRATPRQIEKTLAELDKIEPGKRTRARPYGTLWGYTNIHGGVHRAFKVRGKGLVKEHEYVDPGTFTEGCDTIFLLSDGKPTWDDWPEWEKRLPEHKSGDPESGAETKEHEMGHYYGPYALASWLRDDVRRLNLFRKVEIHCIGIGEYDPGLLAWISRRGLGQLRRVPAPQPKR